jgi:hypothetical protein
VLQELRSLALVQIGQGELNNIVRSDGSMAGRASFMQMSVSLPTDEPLFFKDLVRVGTGNGRPTKELISAAWVGISTDQVRKNRTHDDALGGSCDEAKGGGAMAAMELVQRTWSWVAT